MYSFSIIIDDTSRRGDNVFIDIALTAYCIYIFIPFISWENYESLTEKRAGLKLPLWLSHGLLTSSTRDLRWWGIYSGVWCEMF